MIKFYAESDRVLPSEAIKIYKQGAFHFSTIVVRLHEIKLVDL